TEPPEVPARRPVAAPTRPRPRLPEIDQPPLDFPSAADSAAGYMVLPVAPFRLRLVGCGIDFGLSLAALFVFFLPLTFIAGHIVPNRFLFAGGICAYALLASLYTALFLYLRSGTPGMEWSGLRIVNFNGMPPQPHQLLYRFLGAIASVGSF